MSGPPAWTPAPEPSHRYGQFHEASEEDCDRGDAFCAQNTVERARWLPRSDVGRIAREGCLAWGLEFQRTDPSHTLRETFQGTIHNQRGGVTEVETTAACQDCCLVSTLPCVGGLYYRRQGVYFELTVRKMNGVIAIGTVCRPYPHFRLPGWHRLSAALHLDDLRKFYETSDGGQDSGFWAAVGRLPAEGDTIGCGYEWGSGGTLFFTWNGRRLVPDAFKGLYLGDEHDVYAAIGVDGENAFTVNFGGDRFKWQPGNELGWRLNGHVGNLGPSEDLPPYSRCTDL